MRDLLESTPEDLSAAYAEGRPGVNAEALAFLIRGGARDFILSGVDLMVLEGPNGLDFRVIEVNSAPGFAYCTPGEDAWDFAYRPTVELVLEGLPSEAWPGVALLTESKIPVETEGFARCFETTTRQPRWVVGVEDLARAVQREEEGCLRLEIGGRELTGGLRYLHSEPWLFLPPATLGRFVNGTAIDLCGGRNKISAQRAFTTFTARFETQGLRVRTPESRIVGNVSDLATAEAELGPWSVRKVPCGNSGQGIDFAFAGATAQGAQEAFPLLVQEMLLPPSLAGCGEPHLAGALVDGRRYAFDLRVVVGAFQSGFRPIMLYGRRARRSFEELGCRSKRCLKELDDFLKVNIAVKSPSGGFRLETERLILGDSEGWQALGLDLQAGRRAVAESILATIAVDLFGTEDRLLTPIRKAGQG